MVLRMVPGSEGVGVKPLNTGFRHNQRRAGVSGVHGRDIGISGGGTAPGLIPVEAQPPERALPRLVRQERVGAIGQEVSVMVPAEQARPSASRLLEQGEEVVGGKAPLLLRGPKHGLPGLGGRGLVLHRQTPGGKPFLRPSFKEFADIACPQRPVFVLKPPPTGHGLVVLHPGWCRPGADHKLEAAPREVCRRLKQGDPVFPVLRDREGAERFVSRFAIGVAMGGKVAAVDRRAGEGVAVTCPGAPAGMEDPLLGTFRQTSEHRRAGVGNRCAEP